MAKKNNAQNQNKTAPKPENSVNTVKMVFKEDKYYNDLNEPKYRAGIVYDIIGSDQIQRWLKRGGEIVEGQLEFPLPDPVNPSTVVEPKTSEPTPAAPDQEPAQVDNGKTSGDSGSTQDQDETDSE